MAQLTDEHLKKLKNAFAASYFELKENVLVQKQGKSVKCRYVFYYHTQPPRIYLAVTKATYIQNRDAIEDVKRQGLKQKHETEVKNSWITTVLAEGSCLFYGPMSYETGIRYYFLVQRVPKEVWTKISSYFCYLDDSRDDDEEFNGPAKGWFITERNKKRVDDILRQEAERLMTDEHRQMAERLKKESEEAKKALITKQKRREKQKELLIRIMEQFKNAEYPDPIKEQPTNAAKFIPGYEKMVVEGERIEHPFNLENIYGGGEWFVIQPSWIWHIQNNGYDGSDWGRNNVETGGAGAIGTRVPYSDELADLVRQL